MAQKQNYTWEKYTPPIIRKIRPTIEPALLTASQKQLLWNGIKRDNPALAELLTTDTTIKALKEIFDARILFYADEAKNYINEKL